MLEKNKRLKIWIIFLTVAAFGLGAYFYLNHYFNSELNKYENYNLTSSENIKLPLNKEQKESIISNLVQFKKFGEWPDIIVSLSPARGNPFQEKTIQE